MATQIVIHNDSSIKIDDSFHIDWEDKGNAMISLPSTIHAVIWNDLPGQNEIQNKDASGNMTGNTDLNDASDAVGSTTIADLLTWGATRQIEIEQAQLSHDEALAVHNAEGDGSVWTKTWIDYDPNYS
ncbi:hypothetical protein CMI37_00055 [Candidatus Pacearchaeota archaeon]|nr:hypothetical protein [Candidatus Pacearchaeota archaeon]